MKKIERAFIELIIKHYKVDYENVCVEILDNSIEIWYKGVSIIKYTWFDSPEVAFIRVTETLLNNKDILPNVFNQIDRGFNIEQL